MSPVVAWFGQIAVLLRLASHVSAMPINLNPPTLVRTASAAGLCIFGLSPAKKRECGPFGLMRQALHGHAARLPVTDASDIEENPFLPQSAQAVCSITTLSRKCLLFPVLTT